MRILCVFSQYNYGVPARGEGYEYTNFLPALRQLGHQITFFESGVRACYQDFRQLNESLLRTVERVRPDVVFAVQTHFEIWLETWKIIRDSGIAATLNWATDDSWKYAQFSHLVAPAFTAFATTYPSIYERYRRDGHGNVFLSQWAANAAGFQPPQPGASCRYQISFVGTCYGERPKRIQSLRRRGIQVECFGHGWPNGPVAAAGIPRIIQDSAISLNLAGGASIWKMSGSKADRQIKGRTFEVPGSGGFLLTEWAEGLERYYQPGEEVAVFHDDREMADRIDYYLSHLAERDRIARAGYERTRRQHTYEARFTELLSFVDAQREQAPARARREPSGIDWEAFNRAAARHTLPPRLRMTKNALSSLCAGVWGSVRGPRAARRLVFELSWRLVGAKTYSSAGLPGRMFYKES